jgi:hypothetical protein
MINDIEDAFEKKHGISFNHIEVNLLKKLQEMCISNLKYELIKWRYFDTDIEIIDNLCSQNQYNQNYVDVMENRISECFKNIRDKLATELKDIDEAMIKKENHRKYIIRANVKYEAREKEALEHLNTMPDEIVQLVRDFAFTPKLRCQLFRCQYPTLTEKLTKIRIPKLKTLARYIMTSINTISNKIRNNSSIMKSFPEKTEIYKKLWDVIYVRNHIRETLNKSGKIKEIEKMIEDLEAVIDAIERIGFPVTARKYRRVLLILYNTIMISSRPEFNKKARRTE